MAISLRVGPGSQDGPSDAILLWLPLRPHLAVLGGGLQQGDASCSPALLAVRLGLCYRLAA